MPSWITSSFVDAVRYLDTSPRSYEIRRNIRKGMVELLADLHDSTLGDGTPRYDRIVVVAHSLGGYIAYDGITSLWAQLNKQHDGQGPEVPAGLAELEGVASEVADEPTAKRVADFQRAQGELWKGMRAQGSPWRITDLITLGTPMYFAEQLYTMNRDEFDDRVAKRVLPTCPPQSEGTPRNNIHDTRRWFTWQHNGRRVLYHGAPFAVVRWTNLWFPARLGFFGDWLGGPLQPLYGTGINDIPLTGDRPWRCLPGYAHAVYFKMTQQEPPADDSVTKVLRDALALASTGWLTGDPAADPLPATPT